MRIEFAHADLPPLSWSGSPLRMGSAGDNDVRLEGQGVAAHHVVISGDARGLVLEVCSGAGRVYVNARPVREKALLCPGDSLGIGACHLRLVDDDVPDVGDDDTEQEGTVVMALRAVAGSCSGRVYAIDDALAMDEHGPKTGLHGDNCLLLEPRGRRLHMDATGLPTGRPVCVNGRERRQVVLKDGDQLVLGPHRFLVDISTDTPPRVSPAVASVSESAPETHKRDSHHETWWLLGTAALLALILAGALLIHY